MNASRLCPVCKRVIESGEAGTAADRFHPFCSKRCADVDLGRWLKGSYAIPAAETGDESESEAGASEPEGRAAPSPEGAHGTKPVRH